MPRKNKYVVGIDRAQKDGDYSAYIKAEHLSDGKLMIHHRILYVPPRKVIDIGTKK